MIGMTRLSESSCGRRDRLFGNGDLTFADIRNIFKQVFSGDATVSREIGGAGLFLTVKDGSLMVAEFPDDAARPMSVDAFVACCDGCREERLSMKATLERAQEALGRLGTGALDSAFGNGTRFLECRLAWPGGGWKKCVVTVGGVRQAEGGRLSDVAERVPPEVETALAGDAGESLGITPDGIKAVVSAVPSEKALKEVLGWLEDFVKGYGWKCTIRQYVGDKYASVIADKARAAGLDVSKDSEFVRCLADRLSLLSGRRPSRSDLATYAKKDGLRFRTGQYREFLDGLEAGSDETNEAIIRPLEKFLVKAGSILVKNMAGLMAADPSRKARAELARIRRAGDGEDGRTFKKKLASVKRYSGQIPKYGILITYKGRPYRLSVNAEAAAALAGLIGDKP